MDRGPAAPKQWVVRLAVSTTTLCVLLTALSATTVAAPAAAAAARTARATGGAAYTAPPPAVSGSRAQIVDGLAYAPADAPPEVRDVISAGNRIVGLPYRYGGGHGSFEDTGYDCSGTVSYALGGAGLLSAPLDSTSLRSWGLRGRGAWITVYTNRGHAYLHVAGIRLDTSAAEDPGGLKGPRWRPVRAKNRGFRVRHPDGL